MLSILMMSSLPTGSFKKAVNVALSHHHILGHALHHFPGRDRVHHHAPPRVLLDHLLRRVGMSHGLLRLHRHAITLRLHLQRIRKESTGKGRRSKDLVIGKNKNLHAMMMKPLLKRKNKLLLIRGKKKSQTRKSTSDVKNKKVMAMKKRKVWTELRT